MNDVAHPRATNEAAIDQSDTKANAEISEAPEHKAMGSHGTSRHNAHETDNRSLRVPRPPINSAKVCPVAKISSARFAEVHIGDIGGGGSTGRRMENVTTITRSATAGPDCSRG